MPILIQRQHSGRVRMRWLRQAAKCTLALAGVRDRMIELSIALVTDEAIRELNARYRGKDTPTDVLSFPMEEERRLPGQPRLLGDVVVSVDTAARQAAAGGRGLDEELCHLIIHGVLHLLGYEDATTKGYEEMVRQGEVVWRAVQAAGAANASCRQPDEQ